MSGLYLSRGLFPRDFLRPTVEFVLDVQKESGEIPWFSGGHSDPWDHVEAAMGLSIGGEWNAAELAYRWLAENQLPDGSWWSGYRGAEIDNGERRESNFVAYFATGIWHQYLVTGDRRFLIEMWPAVELAISFVLSLQSEYGDIDWSVDSSGTASGDSLVTGCASIYKSLECAFNISATLGHNRLDWLEARQKLGEALRGMPQRFDRTWESKARYSMDWFYPVLTGVVQSLDARKRMDSRWDEFVEEGLGCRCVVDQPWVTVAESCEMVLALLAINDRSTATEVFSWLSQWREDSGAYWTGYQLVEDILWPDEQPTWTAGAILLAADALTEHTGAANLFTSVNLISDANAKVSSLGLE